MKAEALPATEQHKLCRSSTATVKLSGALGSFLDRIKVPINSEISTGQRRAAHLSPVFF
jgi:hypothetical protein